MPEDDYKKNLHLARNASKQKEMVDTARTLAKAATPLGAVSLIKHINIFSDWLFLLAALIALLKDILDLVGIGSLPAIGTVITICVSITIGFLLLLAGANEKRKLVKNVMKRLLVLAGGTLVEAVGFGLNFLPIETIMVIIIYYLVLIDRKVAAEEEKRQKQSGEMEEEYA